MAGVAVHSTHEEVVGAYLDDMGDSSNKDNDDAAAEDALVLVLMPKISPVTTLVGLAFAPMGACEMAVDEEDRAPNHIQAVEADGGIQEPDDEAGRQPSLQIQCWACFHGAQGTQWARRWHFCPFCGHEQTLQCCFLWTSK